MAEDDVPLEDELRIFQEGVRSPFWLLLKKKWQPLLEATVSSALGPKPASRDYAAGKASGIRGLLLYPDNHIRNIHKELEKRKAQ